MMFKNTVDKYKDRPSLFVQRDGKDISYTWAQYWQNCVEFAMSLQACGV
jgi:long-subunit acyl-CoA synthetase (AMP-forming)